MFQSVRFKQKLYTHRLLWFMFYLKRNFCVLTNPDKSRPLLLNIKVGCFYTRCEILVTLEQSSSRSILFCLFHLIKNDFVICFVYISLFWSSLFFPCRFLWVLGFYSQWANSSRIFSKLPILNVPVKKNHCDDCWTGTNCH